jgi:hypothetical protein
MIARGTSMKSMITMLMLVICATASAQTFDKWSQGLERDVSRRIRVADSHVRLAVRSLLAPYQARERY